MKLLVDTPNNKFEQMTLDLDGVETIILESRAEQSRAEQSRAEQSRAEECFVI